MHVSSLHNRFAASATILFFLAGIITPGITAAPAAPSDTPASSPLGKSNASCLTNTDPDIEILTGADAEAALEVVWAKAPLARMARDNARASMKAKGWKEVGPLTVVRHKARTQKEPASSLVSALSSFFFPTVHAQSGEVSAPEGGFFWNSWDDGDNFTWEGEQGGWENEFWSTASGGLQVIFNDDAAQVPMAPTVLWGQGSVPLANPNQDQDSEFRKYGRAWVGCTAGGCVYGAWTCAFFGPAGPGCYATRCAGYLSACTVGFLAAVGYDYYCRRHPGGFFC